MEPTHFKCKCNRLIPYGTEPIWYTAKDKKIVDVWCNKCVPDYIRKLQEDKDEKNTGRDRKLL